MKKDSPRKPTPAELGELANLAALAESAINTEDAPEIRDWSKGARGRFYRPVKQQLTLRLDADLIAWFKRQGPSAQGYQTRINQALRDYVKRRARKAG